MGLPSSYSSVHPGLVLGLDPLWVGTATFPITHTLWSSRPVLISLTPPPEPQNDLMFQKCLGLNTRRQDQIKNFKRLLTQTKFKALTLPPCSPPLYTCFFQKAALVTLCCQTSLELRHNAAHYQQLQCHPLADWAAVDPAHLNVQRR